MTKQIINSFILALKAYNLTVGIHDLRQAIYLTLSEKDRSLTDIA